MNVTCDYNGREAEARLRRTAELLITIAIGAVVGAGMFLALSIAGAFTK